VILFAALACSEAQIDRSWTPTGQATNAELSAQLRVDVIPAQPGGELPALPFTAFRVAEGAEAVELDRIDSPLAERIAGAVVAMRTNPTVASLPAREVPVIGTVSFSVPGTILQWQARTDEDGAFEAFLAPGSDYDLAILPDDPALPAWSGPSDAFLDIDPIDLDFGVPIYGLVTSTEGPVSGAAVRAVSAEGARTALAVTDETGFYHLRVSPGDWSVVCEGRARGEDPTLTAPSLGVGDAGRFLSFAYPTDLETAVVSGTVTDPRGRPVPGAVVRFHGRTLSGYDDLPVEASWASEVTVSTSGAWVARVVPGTYDVEVVPPVTDDGRVGTGPSLRAGVTFQGDAELALSTTRLLAVRGRVLDDAGRPLRDARVACREVGFDGHEYVGFADARGRVALELPRAALACEIAPPGDRTELPVARVARDADDRTDPTFVLGRGVEVGGEVFVGDAPAAGAVVQVKDAAGALLAFDVTDEDGRFAVPLAPTEDGDAAP
jgi:hypothetical protein